MTRWHLAVLNFLMCFPFRAETMTVIDCFDLVDSPLECKYDECETRVVPIP